MDDQPEISNGNILKTTYKRGKLFSWLQVRWALDDLPEISNGNILKTTYKRRKQVLISPNNLSLSLYGTYKNFKLKMFSDQRHAYTIKQNTI